ACEAVRADSVSARAASGCIRSERQCSPAVWLRVSDLSLTCPRAFALPAEQRLKAAHAQVVHGRGRIMPRGKQGPAGVELTQQLEELNGTERECRVIYDAEAAGKAGMRTIGVLCGGFS